MSKKSYNETESVHKSEYSCTSSSSNEVDTRKKDPNRTITASESQKEQLAENENFGTYETRSKIKKVLDNETNLIHTTSGTSLDEDLYGINDKYRETLKQLKTKLHSLNLKKPSVCVVTPKSEIKSDDDWCHTDFLFNNEDKKNYSNNNLTSYLFDKTTNTSYSNFFDQISDKINIIESGQTKGTFSFDSHNDMFKKHAEQDTCQLAPRTNVDEKSNPCLEDLRVLTILEPVQMHSSSTIISTKAQGHCVNSPFNIKQSASTFKQKLQTDYSCTDLEICSLKSNHSESNNELEFKKSILKPKKSLTYFPKNKTSTSSYGIDENKQESEKRRSHIDLPFTVTTNYTTEENLKIQPSMTTIEKVTKSKRLRKKRNKIVPISKSRSSSSASLSEHKKNLNSLLLKYYKDTPEVSSNSYSTPPPDVSTCASNSSIEINSISKASSIVNFQSLPIIARTSSILYSPRPIYKSIEAFNPIYSSSLDVPKKSTTLLDFPAITKITSFIHYPELCMYEKNAKLSKEKFSTLIKQIKDEVYKSKNCTLPPSVDKDKIRKTVEKLDALKLKTSNSFSFYTMSSTDSTDHVGNNQIDKFDLQSETYSEEEQHSRCSCLCNWLFPKKRRKFFY